MRQIIVLGLLAASFCVTGFAKEKAIDNATWGTFQGNASHNGYMPIRIDAQKIKKRWQVTAGIYSDFPVTGGGMVYLYNWNGGINHEGVVKAIDSETGQTIWLLDNVGDTASDPAYSDGKIYLSTQDENESHTWLLKVDAQTGAVENKVQFESQWGPFQSPTIYNGIAYGCIR